MESKRGAAPVATKISRETCTITDTLMTAMTNSEAATVEKATANAEVATVPRPMAAVAAVATKVAATTELPAAEEVGTAARPGLVLGP
jgi:hypothetical protein